VIAFLNTNILIYAQGSGAKSEVARQAILAGGVISVQVLSEFASVLRRKFAFEWDVIDEAIADLRTAIASSRTSHSKANLRRSTEANLIRTCPLHAIPATTASWSTTSIAPPN